MGRGTVDKHSVSVKVPVATWDVLRAVAEIRAADTSSIINAVLADALPGLLRFLAKHKADMDAALVRGPVESVLAILQGIRERSGLEAMDEARRAILDDLLPGAGRG